jgi:hypothetical protein
MKKLENILAENMRRFGTKNLHEAGLDDLEKIGYGGERDPRTGNLKTDSSKFKLHINRADYDTNISGIISMTFQGSTPDTKETFHDIINDIRQDIESQNDPTGAYDQTRLVSDIEFDCTLMVGADKINFTAVYEEDGDLKTIDIQDEALAKKHGITTETIYDFLF